MPLSNICFPVASMAENTNEEQDDESAKNINMEDIMKTSIKMRSCIGKYFINCKVL